MGTWGTKIYEDDTASDVKEEYIDLLKQGIENEEATNRLIEGYDTEDEEEGPIFWFALANIQWEYGRLLENVKKQALYYIESGIELERWEEDKKLYEKRKEVLKELEEKLNSPMPKEKRIVKHKIYKCTWNIGDVYAYKIKENEEYMGKYIVMIKVGEEYGKYDIWPVVYVYNKMFDNIPKIEDLKNIPYLPQFYIPIAYNENYKAIKYKCLIGIENSTKKYVNEYEYIGNIQNFKLPSNEDNDIYKRGGSYLCFIKRFEEYLIGVYNEWKGIDYYSDYQ